MDIHKISQPISEDFIMNELCRLQEMIMCANMPANTRYIMSTIIDAGFLMLEKTNPGYHRPGSRLCRSGMEN